MKIINLIENTEGSTGCACAHGLSFYIETEAHKLLVDLGPSGETLNNAAKLGVDLKNIDTVVLSHGHYDHSGGIMPFSEINDKAKIYMQKTAMLDYYADDGIVPDAERYRYVGIDKRIAELKQVVFLNGDCKIDDELEIYTVKDKKHEIPFTNRRLLIKNGDEYTRDSFDHEQYLVISSQGKKILVSGCAHIGILNIMDAYYEKYGTYPDMAVSGFHLMKKTPYHRNQLEEIEDIAHKLMQYPTQFITCHCTGVEAYALMKNIMGGKLGYVHSGEQIL
ncbi:MAG: MBL fold metallo-hydrolase [Lachnospiraceae bacterium]|nr:MBL fold metallo-hydrolase [Lachnospiraceae bacterium]